MKKTNRLFSLVLCALIVLQSGLMLGIDQHTSSLGFAAAAAGGNYYRINGKTVYTDSVADPDSGSNNEYVCALYKYVWDTEYTDDFSASDNILKNVSYADRALTADHLRAFVGRVAPGTVLKVENIDENEVRSNNGYEVFIVASDSNGFTVLERTDARREVFYTWDEFCAKYSYSSIRFLKWPNSYFAAGESIAETDFVKPERALYYDAESMLSGDDVRWVQQKLTDAGYTIPADGRFSKQTEAKVLEFQKDFGLDVTGIVDTKTADLLEHPVKVPQAIKLHLDTDQDISRGDLLNVSWEKVDYAESYHIFVYNSRGRLVDELDELTASQASFVMSDSGTFTVKGIAQNTFYQSEESTLTQKVRVHNTYLVQFVDDDGTVLSKQSVPYGMSAATPASPRKQGYTFKGWDQTYSSITSSTTITAEYIQKTFTVVFRDAQGNLIDEQKVLYGEAAVEPDTSALNDFVGWDRDFSAVEQATTVTAIQRDSKDGCIVKVSSPRVVREAESSGYTATFVIANQSGQKIMGRAVVALKTTAGKFLTMTESSAFTLVGNAQKSLKVFVPYTGAATVAEIYIIQNYQKPLPISEVTTVTEIETSNNYTDWLPDSQAPSTYYSATAYRTEYRYRQKSTKTSSASSLAGWIKYNTTVDRVAGGWSGWSTNAASNQWTDGYQTREVQTKSESIVTGKNIREWNTQSAYKPYYRHYWNYNHGAERTSYGQFARTSSVSVGSWDGMRQISSGGTSSGTYWGYNKGNETGRQDGDGMIWFAYSNQTTPVTYYRYQNYTLVYTYYYYKWGEWSNWSTTPVTKTDSVDVETRRTRQYEVNDPTECNTGKSRTITGILDSSLAGKQATLFIYKVGEASDYSNEYIGQTQIAANGSYKFTFKLREEPSVSTGDYTVALGIEGANAVMYLEPIKAPLPEYTVNICNDNGDGTVTILDTQKVARGQSAVLPTVNPTRPGWTFAGWDYSNAGIYEDTNITALYVQDEYTVVFIDWTNERFEMQTGYHYGDPVTPPDMQYDVAGYTPVQWNGIVEGMTVTQNMVVTAKYEQQDVTIVFYDYDKNEIDRKTVEYGESVEPPTLNSDEEHLFLSWDRNSFDSMTINDLDVYPVYCFYKTADAPTASLVSGVYDAAQSIVLRCDTPNAVIYYSINDGETQEYTGPISITETATLRYYASSFGYNDSASEERIYVINKAGEESGWKYPVMVYDGDTLIGSYIVNSGAVLAGIVPEYEKEGYTFDGYYTDADLNIAWNMDTDIVSSAISLYAKTTSKRYSVQFCKADGTVISQQTVTYLGAAEAPEAVPVNNDEVFIKWDTDAYKCVTEDLTVFAVIRKQDEVANITLDKNTMTTMNGMSYALQVTVTPEAYADHTIVWTSSNPEIATVNNEGLVTAKKVGTAVITASLSADGIFTANCVITVMPNKSENICLTSESTLTIADGKLLGVLPVCNTVRDVMNEIDSEELEAYSSEGKLLGEDDLMETGSTLCMVDKTGKILDVVTVVVLGDVNADGKVNNKDASMVLRYLASKQNLSELEMLAADVNNSHSVNVPDVSMILQYVKGMQGVLNP